MMMMMFGIPLLTFDSIVLIVIWLQRFHHLNNNVNGVVDPVLLLPSSWGQEEDHQHSTSYHKQPKSTSSARSRKKKGKNGTTSSRRRSDVVILSRGGWTLTTSAGVGGGLRLLSIDSVLRASSTKDNDEDHDDDEKGGMLLQSRSDKKEHDDSHHHSHSHHDGHHANHKLPGWLDHFKIDLSSSSTISLFGQQKHMDHDQQNKPQKPIQSKFSRLLSLSLLQKQNAETSNAIIEYFKDSILFESLANYEGYLTKQRDIEDSTKLQQGIDYALSKGVITKEDSSSSSICEQQQSSYCEIDVLGKTPDEVATEILQKVEQHDTTINDDDDDDDDEGCVIVICGLSGTGKGTTVSKICQQLQQQQQKHKGKVLNWSNGNIFRSITLLAVTWNKQQQQLDHCSNNNTREFNKNVALTPENLKSFFGMLHFGYYDNQYDIMIDGGLGFDKVLVSVAQNTILKSPEVAKNIPTVAEMIQGEVINFASDAIEKLRKDGYYVLVEGREQTLNYIPTKHRFNLVLSDESLIGKRRAAQRLMATTLSKLQQQQKQDNYDAMDVEDEMTMIDRVLQECLEELTKDLPSSSSSEVIQT